MARNKYPNYEERDSREDAEEGQATPRDNSPEAVAEREYWRAHYASIYQQEAEAQQRFNAEHLEIAAKLAEQREQERAKLAADTGKTIEEIKAQDQELDSFLSDLYGDDE